MKNNLSVCIAIVAAISIVNLSIIFLYFNPYSNQMLDKEVYITIFFILLLPSFLAVIAVLVRKTVLMIFCGVWLLPGTLYLSVAAIPTLWNLYIIFLMIYFISIVWMKKRSAWRE
ncbi:MULTISPECIES: hypothetical protein [Bacillus cereus group]|uniref:hypothetical protein n=1 Tax=Bacillus cereus group TaxID=86661 RepID=UPI001C034BD8|nr:MULTISPECIES: hypothetical protein [Bacillus cereus group]MDM5463133.1 hypothetical protein [Bacillus cereus]QWH38155.1 hypothetical protein EXW53_15300 [Bacillus mycoides]WJE18251.1 hypothetical protein QRY07_15870 [Bacillus cereus]